MGELALARKKRRETACLPLVLSFLLCISASMPGYSASSKADDNSPLGVVEQKLFFKTYGDESQQSRLERIEKRVFGSVMQGDFQERLSRVTAASAPQSNPDGSMTGSVTKQEAGTSGGGDTATVPPARNTQDDDQQAALERARISVQAAREEEISRLMADGVNLWRAKRGREALQRFEQVVKLDPDNAEAHYSAGIVYESTGNFIEAMADYKKAADVRPDNSEYMDAVRAVQKKMANKPPVDPKQAEMSQLAIDAAAAYKRGEFLSAIDLYKQLDAKAPNQALVKYNIGTLYLQVKDPFTALDYYKTAVQLKPNEARYVQAYKQLKANVDKSEAETQQSQQAWQQAGYNSGGMTQAAAAAATASKFRNPAVNMGQPPMQSQPQQQFAPQMAAQGQGFNQGGYPQQQTNQGFPQQQQGFANQGFPQQQQGFGNQGSPQQQQGFGNQGFPQQQQGFGNQGFPQQQQGFGNQGFPQQQQGGPPQQGFANQGYAPQQGNSNQQNFGGGAQNQNQQGAPQQQQTMAPQQNFAQPPNNTSAPKSQTKTATASATAKKTTPPKSQTAASDKWGNLTQKTADPTATYGIVAGASKDGVKISAVGIASRASHAKLRRGDLIRAVDGTVVTSPAQLNQILSKKNGATVKLHVQRGQTLGAVDL
jgi:tetratricopeptide (TPR) repeat protein